MSGGNVVAGFQVYLFAKGMVDSIVSAACGDLSGVGSGVASMAGSYFGGQFGDWVSGGQAFASAVWSSIGASAASAATRAAFAGENIFVASAVGAAKGAAAGIMIGGLSYTAPQPSPDGSGGNPDNGTADEAIRSGDIQGANDAARSESNGPPVAGPKTAGDKLAAAAKNGGAGTGNNPEIHQKITLADAGKPLPSRSELFWRGVTEDLQVYGKGAVEVGSKMGTVGQVFSLPFSPFKVFGAVVGGAGKIDISVGNCMEFLGRWMDAQFPEPYW